MTQKHLFSIFDVTKQVFYSTPLSIGIVNLKPLLPGHVLIIPKRVVPRLSDLNPPEITDLFLAVQKVGKGLERYYNAQALTISLQDGKSAGQSVPHVHVHILPRHSTDFDGENDRIYPLLEENESHLKDNLEKSQAQKETTLPNGEINNQPKMTNGNGNATGNGNRIGENWDIPSDEDRKPRSMQEMENEARALENYCKSIEGTQ
ncbi:bis(5'-adenosyl)-triphosphatase [Kwoniella mangroviensis CBS 10435]|uniref:Bis(5'-adenosyl)-triphosphatase n=1 Tax=Kwoniella mangroviensis CBS 10435 TaxID=1331196 RepID=A0A1B9IRF2_9TREE|nr:bis(5'-adenosyl)-triphosphatase [Kwoniella mangroviensis CBS 10435]